MNDVYNPKRVNPPIWQHDYHVLKKLYYSLQSFLSKYAAVKKKKLTLVDYGCGSMPYKSLYSSYISRAIAVDIGKNPYADILVKEDEPIPLENHSVDIILSTQVLEHVRDVKFYLFQCNRLLKKNGLLLLSTHGLWPYHDFPADYRRWTRKGIEEEIKGAGFSLLETQSILGPFAACCQFKLLLIAERFQNKGYLARAILALISTIGNGTIWTLDYLFPADEISDASVFVLCAEKK